MAIKIQSNTVINDDKSFVIGSGTTSNRPATPATGTLWYNTDLNVYERYDGSSWEVSGGQANKSDAQFLYSNNALYSSFEDFYDGGIALQSAYPNIYAKTGLIYDQIATNLKPLTSYTFTDMNAMVYANSLYVIAGNLGHLRTSTDAINWTIRSSGTAENILSLSYGNGVYVRGSAGGAIGSSTNGINWTVRTSGVTTDINALTIGNGIFVRAGLRGTIGSSTNGINWTVRTSGTTTDIFALTYGNGIYVRGGTGGTIGSSTDGLNWTVRASGTTTTILSLTYGGLFVRGGLGGTLGTSTDAINWTVGTSGTTANITSLLYDSNLYIRGGINGAIGTSTDGINWTTRTSNTTDLIDAIQFDGNQFTFLTKNNGAIGTSTDAVDWNILGVGKRSSIEAAAFGANVYICATENDIYSSTNAINWTLRSAQTADNILDLVYANGLFVRVGNDGRVGTSTDGTNWTARSSIAGGILYGVTYGKGLYVTGGDARLAYSTDAINWTSVAAPGGAANIISVDYVNDRFLFGDTSLSEQLGTSTNGINWTATGVNFAARKFAYFDGRYFAGTETGGFLTSTNAVNWSGIGGPTQTRVDALTSGPDGVYFGYVTNQSFDSSAANSMILTTTDGVNFRNFTGPNDTANTGFYEDLVFNTDYSKLLAVGDQGLMLYSDSGYSYNPATEFKLPFFSGTSDAPDVINITVGDKRTYLKQKV